MIGLALISPAIVTGTSGVISDILSLIERSKRRTPTLNAVEATNSPTLLTRLFASESISSTPSCPFESAIKNEIVAIMSSIVKIFSSVELNPGTFLSFLFIL